MDSVEWARRQGELAGVARFMVAKAWQQYSAYRTIDPLVRATLPYDFFTAMIAFWTTAALMWEDYGEPTRPETTLKERRQARAGLN